ncbi:MAG TPA: RHS repeat domain-containing protein [Rhizomicrobium sp.]|jgi:YD repeat-containing protein
MRTITMLVGFLMIVSASADAATIFTYDDLGRLASVTYDNGMQIIYTYDAAGNRTQVATQSTP